VKIRLEDIPPEGLEVEFTLGRVDPQDLGPQVQGIESPPRARINLGLRGDTVTALGEYEAVVGMACSRCLQNVSMAVAGEMNLVFRPQPDQPGDEVRLGEDELEVSFYQAGEIDLGEVLLGELSLALPMAPLCRPDCPGLCPECGRLLQEGPCQCQGKPTDPRWAKLAKLAKLDSD